MKDIINWQHGQRVHYVYVMDQPIHSVDNWHDVTCKDCKHKHGLSIEAADGRWYEFCLDCKACYELLPVYEGADELLPDELPARIDSMVNHITMTGDRPTLIEAGKAYELYQDGFIGRYYTIAWWSDMPAGFTQVEFTRRKFGQAADIIPVMMMNRQDTAIDQPGELLPDELIIVHGLTIEPGNGVYHLKVMQPGKLLADRATDEQPGELATDEQADKLPSDKRYRALASQMIDEQPGELATDEMFGKLASAFRSSKPKKPGLLDDLANVFQQMADEQKSRNERARQAAMLIEDTHERVKVFVGGLGYGKFTVTWVADQLQLDYIDVLDVLAGDEFMSLGDDYYMLMIDDEKGKE